MTGAGADRKRRRITRRQLGAAHAPVVPPILWTVAALVDVPGLRHWTALAVPMLAVPLWLTVVGLWILQHTDPWPSQDDHCPSCLYDRSATRWDLCPECGDRYSRRSSEHARLWLGTTELILGGLATTIALFVWVGILLS